MKNKLLLLAILLSSFNYLEARTPRVSNRSFSYETIKLPQMALPEDRTYFLSLETAANYGNLATRFQSAMNIPGWVRADNAEYEVMVKLFPIDFARPRMISRSELVTDTAGEIVDTVWFFRNQYKAMGSGSLEIFNKANQAIHSNLLNQSCIESTGREFKSRRAARKHRFREARKFQRDVALDITQSVTAQVNRQLDVLLGIYPIRKSSSLMIVRNKKHKEYQLMKVFWNRFSAKAVYINQHTDLVEMESKLINEIEYLKNIENKYRGSKKADRKIRYMAYRNLATIYQMLEMPDKAIYFAQKIRTNDFRKYNASHLVASAQRMKRLHEIHNL